MEEWYFILKELDLDWDYNIKEYLNRSKSYKDFTEEELARISYKSVFVDRYTTPQLYNHKGRIYTKDLPRKMIEYFRKVKHNLDPNEFGFIEKSRINVMEGFISSNWIHANTHFAWEWTHETYEEAINLSQGHLINDMAWGAVNGVYNPAAVALILWTISQYSNKIKIEQMESFQLKEMPDLSKLSTEELTNLLAKPLLRQRIFKNQWYDNKEENNN